MPNSFPSRKLKKGETWKEACHCNYFFMPPEYSQCDNCLVDYYADGMRPHIVGGCDHDTEYGYSQRQVEVMLRRALKETVVLMPGEKL